jgi:AcrR family transcriptional regulator
MDKIDNDVIKWFPGRGQWSRTRGIDQITANMASTPSKARRERERQEVRAKILEAARELFAEHGYEAVTMRKIAEQIEYTATAIYFHFADKEALIREIIAQDFQSFAQQFRRARDIADPLRRLLAMAEIFVNYAVTHPNHYRLMFMTTSTTVREAGYAVITSDPAQDTYAYFKSCLEEAIASGRLRPELNDAELLVQALWGSMHGVVSLYIAKGKDPWIDWRPVEVIARTVTDLLMRGLRRDGTNQPAAPARK